MCRVDFATLASCIDTPIYAAYDTAVLEIALKSAVIGEQQARAALSCQRKYMLIVRSADVLCAEFGFLIIHNSIRDTPCTPGLQSFVKNPYEV